MTAIDWDDRFWRKVHPEALSGCWLWHSTVDRWGYGRFETRPRTGHAKKNIAHRLAYELVHGPIPAGMHVRRETWACSRCGETGPDRDDHSLSDCPADRRGRHLLTYSPPEHDARVRAPYHRVVMRQLNACCDICREPLGRGHRFYFTSSIDEPAFVCLSHPVREGYVERPARRAAP